MINNDENNHATFKSISQEEAKSIMDNDLNIYIVDVREKDEYENGHIKNAILLPVLDLERNAEKLLKDKDRTVLVYCRSGRRSIEGARILSELGYSSVMEFGGILSWKHELE